VAFIAALTIAAVVAGTGTAGDTKGPPCADFIFGDPGYFRNAVNGSGIVTSTFTLKAPACDTATFKLHIYDYATGTTLLAGNIASTSVSGDTVSFTYNFSAGTAPTDGVCLVGESYFKGRLADSAPDSGCLQVPVDSSGSGSGFS
jgi:hypothetical protein